MVLVIRQSIYTALFLLISLPVLAQSALEYNGPYTVAGYSGNASFSFNIVDGDTLLNGAFKMQHSNLNNLISNTDKPFSITGSFTSSVPNGAWYFKFGNYTVAQIEGNNVAENYYNVKVDGSSHEAYGSLKGGKPNGKWVQQIHNIKGSESVGIRFYSAIEFDNGIPQKSFRVENESTALLGRFLRDGLAHDVWEMYSKESPDDAEKWYFKEGELSRIVLEAGDSGKVVSVYDFPNEQVKVVNLDKRYLQIVNLHQQLMSESNVDLEDGVIKLLHENASHYSRIDNILSKMGEVNFMPQFKVKVAYNPLKNNEIDTLNLISILFNEAEKSTRNLLGSTQLNLLKLADDKVLFQLAVLDHINQFKLPAIEKVVTAYNQQVLEHVKRENMLKKLCINECLDKEIIAKYQLGDSTYTKQFVGPNPNQYNFDQSGVNGFYQFTQYVAACIASIQNDLNKKLNNQAIEQELAEIEELLFVDVTRLNTQIDSLRVNATGEVDKALETIKNSAKKELSEYSSFEDISAKPDKAVELNDCIKTMIELSEQVSKIPSQKEEIKEVYKDDVWNPFTSTVMTEEVKKRITDAYNNVLIPYLVDGVNNNLSCTNAASINTLFLEVYQRMLELREEDTEKLEKKLKKEDDPIAILELFNINIPEAAQ